VDTFGSVSYRQPRGGQNDRGFGLIEIVVTMFLLAIVSLSVLPILMQGIKSSSANATLVTATQLANQQIEQVRSQVLCNAIVPATSSVTTQGVTLQVSLSVGSSCPAAGYPITVPVSVSVTRTDTNAVVASAQTLVFASGP